MILGIMQPYFFPYLGYFDLINCSNQWIVFDTAQYIRHGWVNRNRILHPKEGWQYIIVPTGKHSREAKINDIRINDDTDWRGKILGQLQHYKKYARFYGETIQLVEDCLDVSETNLSKLNTSILQKVCNHINIPFNYEFFSMMNLEIGPVEGPGDWALRISQALGANVYVNPPGGRDIFDLRKFEDFDIKLFIRDIPAMEYSCRKYNFISGLSIIDVLMWNTPAETKKFLDLQKSTIQAEVSGD